MRLFSFCLIALMGAILASSAMADKPQGRVFSTTVCGAPQPCSSLTAAAAGKSVVEQATTCARGRLGIVPPADGMFDDGLDANNCLATRNFPKKGKGSAATMVPYCCVLEVPDSSMCQLNCQAIATH